MIFLGKYKLEICLIQQSLFQNIQQNLLSNDQYQSSILKTFQCSLVLSIIENLRRKFKVGKREKLKIYNDFMVQTFKPFEQ